MNWPTEVPIVAPIQIKHVHFSVSYQWAIYQKYGRESPSGYGPLGVKTPYIRRQMSCVCTNTLHFSPHHILTPTLLYIILQQPLKGGYFPRVGKNKKGSKTEWNLCSASVHSGPNLCSIMPRSAVHKSNLHVAFQAGGSW